MLKALELIGFKSFADKTRFEFPPGITVIVGPNGSGKSNIVDAMKWVLGEQSAKSLRGKDMADVIFKGSGDGGRKMVNSAEATLIFDNSAGQLAIDAPEVHVTRRVYRSGEGEYLINRQPCRLKDIRGLFRGTGVGGDAYSLIEQGKVDRMLQASPRDRRSIFEEAAGISRFKAKKVEAQRRLERVEQNLLRLSDIVEEVESRLRSVRSQATKARRYREYRDRLQELRTQAGLADWRQLSVQVEAAEQSLANLRSQTEECSQHVERLAAELAVQDEQMTAALDAIRACENRSAQNREQIAVRQSSLEQSRRRAGELEETAAGHRRHLASQTGRTGDLQQRIDDIQSRLAQAEHSRQDAQARAVEKSAALEQLAADLEKARSQYESDRRVQFDALRSVAALESRITNLQSQLESARASVTRTRESLAGIEETLSVCEQDLQRSQEQTRLFAAKRDEHAESLRACRQKAAELRQLQSQQRDSLSAFQQRRTAASERVAVLDELDRNYEGLAQGVREVLELSREATSGPFAEVQGLVADLIEASVEFAPLVDVALGDKAQHIVLTTRELLDDIQSGRYQPAGRVGFVSLDSVSPSRRVPSPPDGQGLVGQLETMVACDERVRPMVQRLLGDVWCVETLRDAMALHASNPPATRFVTLAGELVDNDGTVVVGLRSTMAGLVSRRSELRALQDEVAALELKIEQAEGELAETERQLHEIEKKQSQLDDEHRSVERSLADHQARSRALEDRGTELALKRDAMAADLELANTAAARASDELDAAQPELQNLQSAATGCENRLRDLEASLTAMETERERLAKETTAARIDAATCEQNAESLRLNLSQLQEDRHERHRALSESDRQLTLCLKRQLETDLEILRTTSELAGLYLGKDRLEQESRQSARHRTACVSQRTRVAEELQSVRQRLRQLEDSQHQRELEVGEFRHQRNTLAERLREDYEINIEQLVQQLSTQEVEQRDEVEREIADLRRKLNNIGAVNMDALAELDSLESRFAALSKQYQDLRDGKEALQRIISKINADSRRLFEETLEAIRVNFQTLYRKAFGGGRADLVLEEGVDLLEAGVDIIATPPGKPSFSNSLLSGGEKALTAVSLLLAIFQYRPSPFCVLDEVDAPFDEANIGRFVDVLKGFLDWTKFVIVTHSKKTMTAASTLYGVTMQESGVSKRVSVRFEDVTEDGHIRSEAFEGKDSQTPTQDREAA